MEVSSVFLDSNYLIAYFNTDDELHEKALEVGKMLKPYSTPLSISNYIFLEFVTVLAQKAGRNLSRTVGEHILSTPTMRILHVDRQIHIDAWGIFKKTERKDVSFVDCSTAAIIQSESISHILTFDTKDFKALQRQVRFSFFKIC